MIDIQNLALTLKACPALNCFVAAFAAADAARVRLLRSTVAVLRGKMLSGHLAGPNAARALQQRCWVFYTDGPPPIRTNLREGVAQRTTGIAVLRNVHTLYIVGEILIACRLVLTLWQQIRRQSWRSTTRHIGLIQLVPRVYENARDSESDNRLPRKSYRVQISSLCIEHRVADVIPARIDKINWICLGVEVSFE